MGKKVKTRRKRSEVEPIWTIEDGFTQTSLKLWDDCPEQFCLSIVEGWTSVRYNQPIEFGSLFHKCVEQWNRFSGRRPGRRTQNQGPAAVAKNIARDHAKEVLSRGNLAPFEDEKIRETCEMLQAIFPLYVERWQTVNEQCKWISHEEKFDVQYELVVPYLRAQEDCQHDHQSSKKQQACGEEIRIGQMVWKPRKVSLRGVIDGRFRHGRDYGIHEIKTRAIIDEREISQLVKVDFQTLFYAMCDSLAGGKLASLILYDVVRRPQLRRGKKETIRDFGTRIKKDINKRPEHYFFRRLIDITPQDIDQFRRFTLDPLLIRILQWYESFGGDFSKRKESSLHYVNTSALIGKFGPCELFDLIVNRSRRNLRRREAPFPELE